MLNTLNRSIFLRMFALFFMGLAISKGSVSALSEIPTASNQETPLDTLKVIFTPPEGWRFADPNALPKTVKVMVVGESDHPFRPSLSLGVVPYEGTLKEYLKLVKSINDARKMPWKDLGSILTEAGEANLSQLDMKTEWGDVKMMHVMLMRDKTIYILTAASLQEEFPKFYQTFFSAMRSLRFN